MVEPEPSFKYDLLPMQDGDWETVRAIYLAGIATGQATFETDAPDWETWDGNHLRQCRLAARTETKRQRMGSVEPGFPACGLLGRRRG